MEYRYEKPNHNRFKDITGKKFNMLTVTDFAYMWGSQSYWKCDCECGGEITVVGSSLKNGNTKSCGCLLVKNNATHGMSYHTLYERCMSQIKRCHNPNHKHFNLYGGRGIFVCERWRNNIKLMIQEIEDEIGLPPFEGAQIDRIDNNNLGYVSGNIRWVDREDNLRNTRISHNHAVDRNTRKYTPTYNSWRYISRNHEVCEEWLFDRNPDTLNGFKKFLLDMGDKPLGSRLKRINDSLPYSRNNCYWG